MNRRRFFGVAGLAAIAIALPPASYHMPVPDHACHGSDIASKARIGDCYVFTRGTYIGWPAPGIPPKGWRSA